MGWREPVGTAGLAHRGISPERIVRPTKRFLWLPVAVAIAGLLAYAFLLGDRGYLQERALRREMAALDEEIEALRLETAQVQEVVSGLQAGGIEIERIGRERLGLVKPGEITYRLVPMDSEGWGLDKGSSRE
ncbi:septum formation initiator family protein [Candidatus Fermentibacteria bacterium]|nr:septum formation initiator family protein [Candidatus Fermentibacteria bacterium]